MPWRWNIPGACSLWALWIRAASGGWVSNTPALAFADGALSICFRISSGMRSRAPELFASAEADAFAVFLMQKDLSIPYLDEVLQFEHALIRAALYQEGSTVLFAHEPSRLFECLEQGQAPRGLPDHETSLFVRAG